MSNTVLYAQIIAYTIVCIGIVAYGTNMLLASGPVRAILFAIGTLLLFIFFGFRWFSSSSKPDSKKNSWPPTINTCPDYLTFIPAATGTSGAPNTITGLPTGSKGGCVDYLGVSSGTGAARLTKSEKTAYSSGGSYTGTPTYTTTGQIFPYSSSDVTKSTMPTICKACQTAGITWEGVWDGDTCVGSTAAAKGAAAGGGGNCPS